jgi:hypothetical protein
MKLKELFAQMNFFDSLLTDLIHEAKELTWEIELCNWKQPDYKEHEPEMIEGQLIFSQVEDVEIKPSPFVANDNEIWEIRITTTGTEKEMIQVVLSGEADVIVITFSTTGVIWRSK